MAKKYYMAEVFVTSKNQFAEFTTAVYRGEPTKDINEAAFEARHIHNNLIEGAERDQLTSVGKNTWSIQSCVTELDNERVKAWKKMKRIEK